MPESPTATPVHLRDGELLRCDERRAHWLSVLRGRVWVTRADDPDDHFLDAGQAIRLAAGCRALVSAEGPAQLMLHAGESARKARATIGLLLPRLRPHP